MRLDCATISPVAANWRFFFMFTCDLSLLFHMDSSEEEGEEEEEEIIVYANFEEGTVDKETFQIPNLKLKIIGLDSDTPIVQLRDSTFKGEWKDTIGTKLLLEEDNAPEQVDSTFTVTPEIMLKYKCQSSKMIDFSKILLKRNCNAKRDDYSETEEISVNDGSASESLNNVVQCVIKPDVNSDDLMKDIVNNALTE